VLSLTAQRHQFGAAAVQAPERLLRAVAGIGKRRARSLLQARVHGQQPLPRKLSGVAGVIGQFDRHVSAEACRGGCHTDGSTVSNMDSAHGFVRQFDVSRIVRT